MKRKLKSPLLEKERDKTLDRILAAVRRARTFFLTGHRNPDGDTVGSELAFASLLRRLGKKALMVNAEPVPKSLRFLPGSEKIRASKKVPGHYDVAVVFECSGSERMGNIIDLDKQVGTVINIDHHSHFSAFGDINLINTKASSNSEQLYYLFRRARMPITRAEATCLYVGLVTDTGRFQQENTNVFSHEVAAGLLNCGISVADISRRVYYTRSESSLKLLARALSSLRSAAGGKISILTSTWRDFQETGATAEDTEDIINYGLMIPSAKVALYIRETDVPGNIKVSLRGKDGVDLCRIAVKFGGGGHRNAAGFTVKDRLDSAVRRVTTEVQKAFR